MSANQTAAKRNMDRLLASPSPVVPKSSRMELVHRTLKYFDDVYAGDPEIEGARRRRLGESAVVPVALELGTILLKHAQNQTDRALRESELAEAEKLLLQVVRLSGEGRLSVDVVLPDTRQRSRRRAARAG